MTKLTAIAAALLFSATVAILVKVPTPACRGSDELTVSGEVPASRMAVTNDRDSRLPLASTSSSLAQRDARHDDGTTLAPAHGAMSPSLLLSSTATAPATEPAAASRLRRLPLAIDPEAVPGDAASDDTVTLESPRVDAASRVPLSTTPSVTAIPLPGRGPRTVFTAEPNLGEAVVIHAAGAVELTIPADWTVREVPAGRQIRLAILPFEPDAETPSDGLWLSYHFDPDRHPQTPPQLVQLAAARLTAVTEEKAAPEEPQFMNVGRFHAVRIPFTMAAGVTSPINVRGFYLLFETDWGFCELHAMAPEVLYAKRENQFQSIVASMKLNAPSIKTEVQDPAVTDARPLIGSWKAFQSRLRLSGDGRVSIVTDQPFTLTAEAGERQQASEITGHFRAEKDVLWITWDDGSKLNFRWRIRNNRLLLTDHEGKMTQLRRILE